MAVAMRPEKRYSSAFLSSGKRNAELRGIKQEGKGFAEKETGMVNKFHGDEKASGGIRVQTNDVLCIDFVEWNQVSALVDDLDAVLEKILSLSKTESAVALDLVLSIPKRSAKTQLVREAS